MLEGTNGNPLPEKILLERQLEAGDTKQKEEVPSTTGKKINTALKFKIEYALEGITKEMDMVVKAKIDVDVALKVVKYKMNKIKKF